MIHACDRLLSALAMALLGVGLFALPPTARAAGDELLTPELIEATEAEARKAAELAHRHLRVHNEVHRDLDAHGLELNSAVILSEQLRERLEASEAQVNRAGIELRNKVISVTGTRENATDLMFALTYHWGRELYGFGNKEELDALMAERRLKVWAAVGLCGLVVASVGRWRRSGVDHITPVEVPSALRRVRLPGFRYAVGYVTGVVADKDMWTRTQQTQTTSTDSFGNRVTDVSTTTLVEGRVYLLTHDGQEKVYDLFGENHPYRPGNVVTIVNYAKGRGIQFLGLFNHDTNQWQRYGLWRANGTPKLLTFLATGVLAYYGSKWARSVGASVAASAEHSFWLNVGFAALVAAGVTIALHVLITFVRNVQFKWGFERRARRLLSGEHEHVREALMKRFTSRPAPAG